jgi:probable rRNA maturation factor
MPVDIVQDSSFSGIDLFALRDFLNYSLQALQLPFSELSVRLTTDARIRQLNKHYRGQDRATDVLSFGMREYEEAEMELPPDTGLLGDLVISVPAIRRQAAEHGATVMDELLFIALHGFLHLMGYDHNTEVNALRMEVMQRVLLNSWRGTATTYGRTPGY